MPDITTPSLDRLATNFYNTPGSPNLKHFEVWNTIESVGGETAINYGIYLATPFRQRWKQRDAAWKVSDCLRRVIAARQT